MLTLRFRVKEEAKKGTYEIKKGDVNGDSVVNLADARMVLCMALKIENSPNTAAADVNGDGMVSLEAVCMILKAALKILVIDENL